ncbi:hypothetical protein V2G26_008560 [Clonostachys chloroleuca]
MEPAPPDHQQRHRLSWSSTSGPHGGVPSLPRPHSSTTNPLPLPRVHNHPQPPYASFTPRPADLHSAPPTPVHPSPVSHHPEPDRRHHDQEPYAPMHDHYQPQQQQQHHHHPVSPAQGPYQQSYPPRDPSLVKREPHDDSRRSSSTGHATDISSGQHPPTPHHSLPPPPSYPDNQPRHMNYDNGHPVPGGYRPPSYPPPTPVAQQAQYEPPHTSYSSNSDPYYSVYPSSIPAKKKNTRASQACDQCRQLKAKCDETKPCKTCRDKGLECRYRDPVPKATDKAQADILEGITSMQNTLVALVERFDRMDNRLTTVEKALKGGALSNPAPMLGAEAQDPDYPPATLPSMNEEEAEAEPGRPIPPGEPAIPMNHTTLAGLLLEWPSIRELTRKHVEKVGIRYISEYPISVEQSRGPLLVYGRGEDNHSYRHIVKEPENHGTVDIADDNSSDMASPSPAADFGLVGGLSPPDMVEYKGGVLAFDGTPDFTELKVWAYVESFKDNILNMHPIITPKTLENWVRQFLDNLPMSHPRSAKPQAVKPAFAFASTPTPTPTEQTGSKRKRSPGPDGSETPMTPGPIRTGKPTRSVHSALVLTILALGKICMHRDNIPDVVHPQPTSDSGSHGSPSIRNGVIPPSSPSQGSPPGPHSYSQSPAQASPMDQAGRGSHSRRPSVHGTSGHTRPGYSLKKNFDVIPGLEYFAYATDILGNLTGSYNNMKNVYANIFASLYQGQLGRPLESFAFIHKASHQLQVLMRPSLDKLQAFKKKKNEFIVQPKYNNLALAFWTCLQLESDLIAEFPLPPSGLLSYEDDMPHPSMILMAGFDQRILDSYPGQLYLRTHLNSIHRMFYAPDDPDGSINDNKFQNVDLVADAVSGMHWVAPSLSFKEDDPPGEDILSARLRAKYWGAQVITYRPFVRQILQFSYSVKNGVQEDVDDPSSRWSEFRSGIIAPFIHPDTKSLKEIDPAMIELARKGINALIESTRAFHGLGDQRPIITNVFGTAHAQWGNLLVLSAAFKDPLLGGFVPEHLLKTLFHKTIAFLKQSATATSSLRFDMIILEGLQRDLFSPEPPRTNSSFSSHTSTTQPRASATATPHMSHVILNQGHGTPPISPRMREPYNTSAPN